MARLRLDMDVENCEECPLNAMDGAVGGGCGGDFATCHHPRADFGDPAKDRIPSYDTAYWQKDGKFPVKCPIQPQVVVVTSRGDALNFSTIEEACQAVIDQKLEVDKFNIRPALKLNRG